MTNFGIAIKRPFTNLKNLVIGVILQMIPILNFIAQGYYLKCVETANKGKFESPEWTGWGDLFLRGLLATVIGFIYMLPFLIVLAVSVGVVLMPIIQAMFTGDMSALDPSALMATFTGAAIGILIALVLLLIAVFLLPVALAKYAIEGNFGAAFGFGTIIRKALTGTYIILWIVLMVYTFIITAILSFVPFIGSVIGAFLGMVALYTAVGEVYSKL